MNGKQRLLAAIAHQEADRPPIDMGATSVTGMHAGTMSLLRDALGLEHRPVKVHEVFQQLGYPEEDLLDALGVDVVGLWGYRNFVGVRNRNYQPYDIPHGIPGLISGDFAYDIRPDGSRVAYPQGDRSLPPSMHMPAGGYFFDGITRGTATADDCPDAREDYRGVYTVMTDEEARYYEEESRRLAQGGRGVVGLFGGAGFGDVAYLPGVDLRQPRGIRSVEEWMMTFVLYPEYAHEVFSMQLEAGLKNLEIYREAVGDRIQVIMMGGTDYGTQISLMQSAETYRTFYKPYVKKMNDWVHEHTNWKTFYHSCGAVYPLIGDFIEAGVDILNPVQVTAAGMDPAAIKKNYGDRLTFWGGGVDTQHALPFGTPEECRANARAMLDVFAPGGGYVFNSIHNIQAKTPVENILAVFDEARSYRFHH